MIQNKSNYEPWKTSIINALNNLGGEAHRSEIIKETVRLREEKEIDTPESYVRTIQRYLENDADYNGKDIFYNRNRGEGIWGLQVGYQEKSEDDSNQNKVKKNSQIVTRYIRNTKIINDLKFDYNNKCQICSKQFGKWNYSEGHHIIPLSENGEDVKENILIVCPNCHAELDFKIKPIILGELEIREDHNISLESIEYHNSNLKSMPPAK